METQRLTAFFELRDMADHAVREIVALGIPAADITVSDGTASPEEESQRSSGLLGAIQDSFMPEKDRRGQTEGHARHGHILSVTVDTARRARVEEILARDGASPGSSP